MPKLLITLLATALTAFAAPTAFAASDPGAQITRPAGYKPMAAKPLPWNSKELAGLAAYLLTVQKTFKPSH
ncbi:hypothetical protein [Rhodoferax sp.]|uniref:hypothetical protein n=1 Tax=Rhodoferax sp. TaxID=50421 RepID=UPI00284DEFE5|nr:hypothetical protein [Rhodoferax sp.]MDR3370420.1 hypothetical protein [Rhodoferax sp.]